MAGAEITMTDILNAVSDEIGVGFTCPADTETEGLLVRRLVTQGLREFYTHKPVPLNASQTQYVHQWSFLKPLTSINLFADVASTLNGAPVLEVASLNGPHVGVTTITTNESAFEEWMVGRTIGVGTTGNAVITAYNSPTSVDVDTAVTDLGDATVELYFSTVTIDDAQFDEDMEGMDLTIDATGYEILHVHSSTVAIVSGDASSHLDEDEASLSSGGDYVLPVDFGGLASEFTFDPEQYNGQVKRVNESFIRRLRAYGVGSGYPIYAAVCPVAPDTGSSGDHAGYTLMVYPAVVATMNLNYRYSIAAEALVDLTREIPYGANMHGLAIRASCLAVAEREVKKIIGVHNTTFDSLLIGAIRRDIELSAYTLFAGRKEMKEVEQYRHGIVTYSP